ncbi:hypothetical protein DC20_14705 [Rufibacter tibetensis]|uniref:Uncharacterized protein n=1 Tax=Rufibacter tibetensis TaxID=512763 RepID=A0A0P0CTQ0_9BACT|nr:hypothetical protein DC20_14705 [Rufibacter tibetensis]
MLPSRSRSKADEEILSLRLVVQFESELPALSLPPSSYFKLPWAANQFLAPFPESALKKKVWVPHLIISS